VRKYVKRYLDLPEKQKDFLNNERLLILVSLVKYYERIASDEKKWKKS
jgi:hypothetical protein